MSNVNIKTLSPEEKTAFKRTYLLATADPFRPDTLPSIRMLEDIDDIFSDDALADAISLTDPPGDIFSATPSARSCSISDESLMGFLYSLLLPMSIHCGLYASITPSYTPDRRLTLRIILELREDLRRYPDVIKGGYETGMVIESGTSATWQTICQLLSIYAVGLDQASELMMKHNDRTIAIRTARFAGFLREYAEYQTHSFA